MLILLSPSKTLNFEDEPDTDRSTDPEFLDEAQTLIELLRDFDLEELQELMDISEDLAELNEQRYEDFETPFTPDNAKQSIFAFEGDVYQDIDPAAYDDEQLEFLQDHVRILSGLYGLLRPLDLMQAYRLEMGTKLDNPAGDRLYDFWEDAITEQVADALDAQSDDIILNLASNQYFDAVDTDALDADVINPKFKDWKSGRWMTISFYLKKVRGTMTDFVVRNKITDPEALSSFTGRNYTYDDEKSEPLKPVYLRDES
jgi:cytoplasmic iron level regulating protein YaaA (DUF328/UPF0246 family)